MASKQPPKKKSTGAAKKAVSKRGVARKKATPRKEKETPYNKPISRAELNRNQLKEDIEYYRNEGPRNTLVRTKGTAKHPKGLPLSKLEQVEFGNPSKGYRSKDGDIHISEFEYNKLSFNARALPKYEPIYRGTYKNGRKKIIGYRRAGTHNIVSEHYRKNIFGKYFRGMIDEEGRPLRDREAKPLVPLTKKQIEELNERNTVYLAAREKWKRDLKLRENDLVNSYRLIPEHRNMSRDDVLDDPIFQELVEELHVFTKNQTLDSSREAAIRVLQAEGIEVTEETVKDTREALALAFGQDPRYKEVLVLLGRRLPSDTNPVGDMYPMPHVKFVVKPFYDAQVGATVYEGDDE